MSDDGGGPAVLVSTANDVEAAIIVNALADHGVEASATGGYTSGFKAEAPGEVKVVVKHGDTDRAQKILSEVRSEQGQIDWSNVEFGDPE